MSKRPDGTGAVYQDKRRGTYIGEVWLDGKRRRVTAKTKAEASRRVQALIRQHARGELSHGNATVGDVIEAWQSKVLAAKDHAPKTAELYAWSCDLITDHIGNVRLRSLTVERIETMLDELTDRAGEPLSRRSLKLVRSTLAQALDFAVRRKVIGMNPARVAELPATAAKTEPRTALTAEQAATLWAALGEEGTEGALFRMQLATGLRPGEAAGLCWDALDLDGEVPTLTVMRAVRTERNRPVLVDELKTKTSVRRIQLSPEAVEVLNEQRKRVARMQGDADEWAEVGLVFPTANGTPLEASNRRRTLARVCRDAGLPEFSPNELRHTAASLLVESGAPIDAVADLLGHTSIAMLAGTYRHRTAAVVDAAAAVPFDATGSG